jgi:hypothetical protein
MSLLNKYDLKNIHGALICQHIGCRKHTKLLYKYDGLFCNIHKTLIQELLNSDKDENIKLLENIIIRKIIPNEYIDKLYKLESKYMQLLECMIQNINFKKEKKNKKIKIENTNKDICYFINCNNNHKLIKKFRGKFCEYHKKKIEIVRYNIKRNPYRTIEDEIYYRVQEILSRKDADEKHKKYVKKLSEKIK